MTNLQVLSPIDGEPIADVAATAPSHVPSLVEAARRAQASWARQRPEKRAEVLFRVADLIGARLDSLAELESRNTGKLLGDTRREALRAAEAFRYYAGWADKVAGETTMIDSSTLVYTVPEPRGVVAGIVPWNVPFFFAAKKIAPALAMGNACVLKPAPETPLTAMALLSILTEAGVPDDLVALAVGGADVGEALVDAGVDLVVFTGSTAAGRRVAERAGRALTPVVLELGGKSPQLVFADADLDAALDAVVLGVFASCGQMCIAGSRLLVEDSLHDDFVAALGRRVEGLRVGSPFEQGTNVGPQVTAAQRDKTRGFLTEAERQGRVRAQAAVPTAPELAKGFWVAPTLLTDLAPDARVLRDEVFGPVLTVQRFRSVDEAADLANRTPFGLAAGVWTADLGRAHSLAARIRSGTVWLNTYRVLSERVPFGGRGDSGHGAENGTEAVRLYTQPKAVWTSFEPRTPPGFDVV